MPLHEPITHSVHDTIPYRPSFFPPASHLPISLLPSLLTFTMPRRRLSASLTSPTVDIFVDLGNPLLNRTFDGFLKIGTVGVAQAAAKSIFLNLKKESLTKRDLEHMVKRTGKDGLQWGVVAGVYCGMHFGVERVRGRSDWKNALIGGVLTGALLSFAGEKLHSKEKLIEGAITGGAIATASEFLRHLTC